MCVCLGNFKDILDYLEVLVGSCIVRIEFVIVVVFWYFVG